MASKPNNSFKRAVISSSCGALITSLLMTPLDVVKIRLVNLSLLVIAKKNCNIAVYFICILKAISDENDA